MEKIRLEIPHDVDYILRKLGEAGFEAFAVGGCVRDALLGRVPNDWDITTSARPQEVKKVFRRTIDTGLQHGTVTVLMGKKQPADKHSKTGEQDKLAVSATAGVQTASQKNAAQSQGSGLRSYEVTTYRIDGSYEDSRHPKEVTFTSNLEEDLRRRDFTINAMAYHPDVGIVDVYGGMADLEEGVIRAVGNPRERFDEDALRIMRAVRFSAQLGFAIDPETAMALKEFAPRLRDISHERIRDEFLKLITSPYPETFELLYNMKITKEIFPRYDEMMSCEPAPGRIYNYSMGALFAMEEVSPSVTLRLATLLLHMGDEMPINDASNDDDAYCNESRNAEASAKFAKEFLREMRLDNNTIRDVAILVENGRVCGVNAVASLNAEAFASVRLNAEVFASARSNAEVVDEVVSITEVSEYDVRLLMNKACELMPSLIELMYADAKGYVSEMQINNASDGDSAIKLTGADNVIEIRSKLLARVEKIRELYDMILKRGDCTSLKTLALTGADLIAAGFKPGPGLGKILASLLDEVLRDPAANEKEHLLERARILNMSKTDSIF